MSNNHISACASDKNTCETITTKVSLKIRFLTHMFTLTYVYVEYETSIFSLHIRNDDRNKIFVLPIFQVATWFNSQNPYESQIENEICHIILYMNIGIKIRIFEVSNTRKWGFWLYISSIHDYWPPNIRKSLVHNSRSEMEGCEKRKFVLLKMRKKKNFSWNIKPCT